MTNYICMITVVEGDRKKMWDMKRFLIINLKIQNVLNSTNGLRDWQYLC